MSNNTNKHFIGIENVISQSKNFSDAHKTDPEVIGLMDGFPPSKEKTVTRGNWYKSPYLRWAMHHSRQLQPSVNVRRGNCIPAYLDSVPQNLDELVFVDDMGQSTTLKETLIQSNTDAFLVMHRGKIVYEKYFIGMKPHQPHGLASVTKSFVGTLVAMELHKGNLKADDKVDMYIPELLESAFGDATIQQLLDMQVVCDYPILFPNDNYIDNQRKLLLTAMGTTPANEGYKGPKSIYDFLDVIRKSGEHGSLFCYSNGPTEVLGWILRRVSGKSLSDLLSEEIWSKLGAEEDAYFIVDGHGTEQACGGLNATLRDMARFAEMIRNDGFFNGQEIVPKAVIDEIRKGGNRELFALSDKTNSRPGFSYHNQWWITHNRFESFEANGLYGQRVHIAPQAEMVAVQFSTHPGHSNETSKLFANVFEAVAEYLN
ncbi:serine hydrolase domain-containing protein [Neobacillus bataviensis]|uniref:serine hydrolase domain-containing protein n=1 Tax=Neobacillus bataviensis TaxID=220685 RepID=UPI001CBECE22|nr:serine hydrolase [Neobacillus bataviensis]